MELLETKTVSGLIINPMRAGSELICAIEFNTAKFGQPLFPFVPIRCMPL